VSPQVLLAPTAAEDPTEPLRPREEPKTKEAEVQTQYRESEAQTTPYTPECEQPEDGRGDELAMLAGLTFENGLPAGRREVEMIENARRKRSLERTLPPGTDEAHMNIRTRLMEHQEMHEFNIRTGEIDRAQQERLDTLRQAIQERDEGNEFVAEQRVELLRQQRMDEKEAKLAKIQTKRIKVLRKLAKERGTVRITTSFEGRKRDIIGEYAEYSSKVYAPIKRDGASTNVKKRAAELDVSRYTQEIADLPHLENLEASLPLRTTQTRSKKPPLERKAQTEEERKAQRLTENVAAMHTLLVKRAEGTTGVADGADASASSVSGDQSAASLPAWRTWVAKAERPPTPDVNAGEEGARRAAEDVQVALGLLQRLLRGRSTQNSMYEGRNRRRDLIEELRGDEVPETKEETLQKKLDETEATTIDTVAGVPASNLLDYLAKERTRNEEKDKIQALAKRADDMRRKREVEESGRRQAEERLHAREDEVYRQVVKAHYSSASTFVDSIVDDSIDRVASGAAIDELRENPALAKALLEAAQATPRTSESLTRDLVASFLNPAVEQIQEKQQEADDSKKFLDAAHKTVAGSVEELATSQS